MPKLKTRTKATDEPMAYDAVASRIETLIDGGTLRVGDRVPSVRHLSKQMNVAVGTVLRGYQVLEARGRIQSRPQSGFYVRSQLPPLPEPRVSTPSGKAERPSVSELVVRLTRLQGVENIVPLGVAVPSPDVLPIRPLHRVSASIARRGSRGFAHYDEPPGCRELRVQVAKHYMEAGCAMSPDEILTTCGCQEALGLCLLATAKAGDVIAVDAPSYYGQLQTIEHLGMKSLHIATDPREGINLDALARALRTKKIAACMFTTNCHNPLGFVMPDEKKRQLVALLAKHDVPLIEDDTYGDLAFDGRPTVCKAYDEGGRVLLCSSFSKTLAPGARVGWCAPGRYFEKLMHLKFCSTIATSTLPQLTIAEFLASGAYENHLRKMRKFYAGQVEAMSQFVRRSFPDSTCCTRPVGGHVLWLEMPKRVDAVKLFEQAAERKISVAPGPLFCAESGYANCVRVNCSHAITPSIEEAIRTLGQLAATF